MTSANWASKHGRHRRRIAIALVVMALGVVVLIATIVSHTPLENLLTAQDDGQADHAPEFGIAQVTLGSDADGDGIDDQVDLLEGARAYVATKPRYKSAYYAGGYPTDGYGVCTDVVAAAYLAAGYDLRELVDADVRSAQAEYGIDTPDPNIDYRRVRVLRVYFERNATSLTCDPTDISQWQGGDIVVMGDHIGVVSDKRNERGVTYVIHHSGPGQLSYEEDILESRDDIVGHYRLDPTRASSA